MMVTDTDETLTIPNIHAHSAHKTREERQKEQSKKKTRQLNE